MYEEKIENLHWELEEARKRNLHLKEKKVYLENEVDGFQFKMIDNNMKKAERKEGLDTLTAEVQKLRKQNNDVKYRLEVANEEIIILNEKLDNYKTKISETRSELKPISDDLKSGSDLLDCLQEVLLKLRLRSAEKESTIIELKAVLKELQAEADTLREQKPDSVRMLQEQLMQQTCRERETLEEFRRIKKELGELSEEVHCFCLQQDDSLEPFSANFNFFEAKRKAELKGDIERSVMRTINLLEEKDHLVFKINRLEDDLDEIKKKSYFNESLRLNLEEVAKSVKMKENEFQDEMKKKREKFEFLEGAMQEKIGKIKTEEANKDDLLKELSCRIEKLTLEILETEKAVYAEGKSAIKIEELEEMCEKLEKQL